MKAPDHKVEQSTTSSFLKLKPSGACMRYDIPADRFCVIFGKTHAIRVSYHLLSK